MFAGISIPDLIIYMISILVSLSVHEAMHAFTGLKLGDDTAAEEGRVSLNPLRHIDPVMTLLLPLLTLLLLGAPILAAKPVPFNPARVKFDEFGAALIALAGPLSNLVLAVVAAVVAHLFAADYTILHVLGIFIRLNVAVFVFNMVPIPPLDGSRVLYAFAPDPVRRLFEVIEPYGFAVVIALVVIGGFGGILVNINQYILHLLQHV